MLAATLFLAIATAQASALAATDCAAALERSTSTATAQVCLAEAEFAQAQTAPKNSQEWTRRLGAAAALYKRALALPGDAVIKRTSVERLLVIFDEPLLNDPSEMLTAFQELIQLRPTDVEPLLRYAKYQEAQGWVEAAEDTLLAARRLQPGEIEPFRMLAQFYARRASLMHAAERREQVQEETPPGVPDQNGVYRVGGSVTPPRRFGNATYPVDATAAGIEGAVVAEVTIDESGVITDARVVKSIPLLDDAALKAVREWRYDPTTVNGKAVPVKMTVTVSFSLRR